MNAKPLLDAALCIERSTRRRLRRTTVQVVTVTSFPNRRWLVHATEFSQGIGPHDWGRSLLVPCIFQPSIGIRVLQATVVLNKVP